MTQLFAAIAISLLMITCWLVSLRLRNAGVVDIAWGLGFVLTAWTAHSHAAATSESSANLLLPCMVTVWGLRLSGYLLWRNHGRPEDFRYRAMRAKWGESFGRVSFWTVFALQGSIMWIVSLPLQYGVESAGNRWMPLDSIWAAALFAAGFFLWGIGLAFETIGDWQLARFKRSPGNQGHVLESGLWRYTRHPNYFGDFLVWWGFYFCALANEAPWWTLVGPLLMSILLMRVSGVTLLERSLRRDKPQYAEYMRRTSPFFPWPPRHS